MRFMMLVKSDASAESGVMPTPKELADMNEFNDEMTKAGVMLGGEGLHASSKGARLRCNKKTGKVTVIDGPFAESKELVAGYWLIQTKSKAEAVEWAKKVPFESGEVEIRPLFELEDFPTDPKKDGPETWREKEQELRDAPPSRGNKKMRFIGFVKGGSDSESGVMPSNDALETMGAFMEEGAKAGVFLGGEGLRPTKDGVRVRYDGKNRRVLDGPFAESKEIIAGYCVLAVDSKEEAVAWSKRFVEIDAKIRPLPEVECEIRLLAEPEDFPPS
jgi:hypothetical protein